MSDSTDDNLNTSSNEHFQEVLKRGMQSTISRRSLIRGGLGFAALSSVPFLSACGGSNGGSAPVTTPAMAKPSLAFSAVGKSMVDNIMLPAGYTYTVLHATGDRLVSTISAYSNLGTETDDWSQRVGDHHDGMDIFYADAAGKYSATDTLASSGKAVIVMNHESSADAHFFHPNGQSIIKAGVTTNGKKFNQFPGGGSTTGWDFESSRPQDEVLKEINHHGVSIAEMKKTGAAWSYVLDSSLNRRVTPQTLANVTGPAAQLADIKSFMVTKFDATGSTSRGTINNCGHGKTPWGTYLACEENWPFYFNMLVGSTALVSPSKARTSNARYGVATGPATATSNQGQGWMTVSSTDDRFTRWNIAASGASAAADFRNEANTFGYIFEMDPLAPNSRPAKRVSLGRFSHEACVSGLPVAGKPLAFYSGDDSRNEYIYKFVSAANWDVADVGKGMAAGDKYLTEGKLYVARFNADGSGDWLELSLANIPATYTAYAFANQADVLINARLAADAVGATKMDRPEWGAVNPRNGEIYFTLTNNNAASRTPTTTNAANPRAYTDNDTGGTSGNPNGHIVRFKEQDDLSTAVKFTWDIFLFGAEDDQPAAVNRSGLTATNSLSSPDGLWFSQVTGICWIQTDDGAYTSETNCMLLAAVPGAVGDGGKTTITNTMTISGAPVTGTQETFLGAALGETNLRRFLVAPKGAEVTGLAESADGKALFINIQHPGESTPAIGTNPAFTFESQWPGNATAPGAPYGPAGRPRSATIVVTRTDGGVIGVA